MTNNNFRQCKAIRSVCIKNERLICVKTEGSTDTRIHGQTDTRKQGHSDRASPIRLLIMIQNLMRSPKVGCQLLANIDIPSARV